MLLRGAEHAPMASCRTCSLLDAIQLYLQTTREYMAKVCWLGCEAQGKDKLTGLIHQLQKPISRLEIKMIPSDSLQIKKEHGVTRKTKCLLKFQMYFCVSDPTLAAVSIHIHMISRRQNKKK